MAGAATAAYSADVLTSSGTADGHHHQWEYAVPTRQDVSLFSSTILPIFITAFSPLGMLLLVPRSSMAFLVLQESLHSVFFFACGSQL